jgi:hypothetical protein
MARVGPQSPGPELPKFSQFYGVFHKFQLSTVEDLLAVKADLGSGSNGPAHAIITQSEKFEGFEVPEYIQMAQILSEAEKYQSQ